MTLSNGRWPWTEQPPSGSAITCIRRIIQNMGKLSSLIHQMASWHSAIARPLRARWYSVLVGQTASGNDSDRKCNGKGRPTPGRKTNANNLSRGKVRELPEFIWILALLYVSSRTTRGGTRDTDMWVTCNDLLVTICRSPSQLCDTIGLRVPNFSRTPHV